MKKNWWFAMCMSPRHTAKGGFVVCSAQRHTAKYLPPIYLKRGKLWQLSAVRFAAHGRQNIFPANYWRQRQSFVSWSTDLPCIEMKDHDKDICAMLPFFAVNFLSILPWLILCRVPSWFCAVRYFFAVISLRPWWQRTLCRVPGSAGSRHRTFLTANFNFPVVKGRR